MRTIAVDAMGGDHAPARDRAGRGPGLAGGAPRPDHPGGRRAADRRHPGRDAPRRRAPVGGARAGLRAHGREARRGAGREAGCLDRWSPPSWSPTAAPTRWSRPATPAPACWPRRAPGNGCRECAARRWPRSIPPSMRRGEKHDPFSLILDVGATLDVDAEDLVAFALMGAAYAVAHLQEPPAHAWRCSRTAPRPARARRHRRGAPPPGRAHRAQLHRQRRGRRHPARHRRRDRVLGLRRQRGAQDARGRLRDDPVAGQLRLQGEAGLARSA